MVYLNEKIDNDSYSLSQIKEDYWNISMKEAIDSFYKKIEQMLLDDDKIGLVFDEGGIIINLKDIKNANAGNSFNSEIESKWVIPWQNIDRENYQRVRGEDKTLSVLNNVYNLQFTRDQQQNSFFQDDWIRLLMPKYTRRVEVEDLNRNFWVIGQTIAAVSAELFDEGGEIPKVLTSITNEIMQLWENVLYLWVAIAMESEKVNNDIHIEMFPISLNLYQNYNKYDWDEYQSIVQKKLYQFYINPGIPSFIEYDDTVPAVKDLLQQDILSKINYLRYKYKNQNLFIIPYYRIYNYEHNYYQAIVIPGFFSFHRAVKEWKFTEYRAPVYSLGPAALKINGSKLSKIYTTSTPLFGFNQNKENYTYNFAYPNTAINSELAHEEQKNYYSALRIIPHLKLKLTTTEILIDTDNDESYFEVYDAVGEMCGSQFNDIISQNSSGSLSYISEPVCRMIVKEGNGYLRELIKERDDIRDSNSTYWDEVILNKEPCVEKENISALNFNRALYLGELISSKVKNAKPQIIDADFDVVKIGDFYPLEGLEPFFTNANTYQLKLITTKEAAEGESYDTATYGIGSYQYTRKSDKVFTSGTLKYLDYNLFYGKDSETNPTDISSSQLYSASQLTKEIFTKLSIQYIENLYSNKKHYVVFEHNGQDFGISNEPVIKNTGPHIYATRIGIRYWTGAAGGQWNYGIITNLIYWDGKEAISIGEPYLFDGYWTNDNEAVGENRVFRVYQGSRWRRINLHCNSLQIKKEKGINKFYMEGGKLTWFDHNRDLHWKNEKDINRPNCKMELVNSDNGVSFSFSEAVNPMTNGNTQMYPTVKFNSNKVFPNYSTYKENRYGFVGFNDLDPINHSLRGANDADVFIMD